MSPRHLSRSAAGFTLTEMLVALAVTALAALVLAIGISRIGLARRLADRGDERVDAIVAAQFQLRTRIAAMQPLTDPQTGNTLDLAGKPDSLDFIADAPDRLAPDALQRYRLALGGTGDVMLYRLSTLDNRTDPHGRSIAGWAASRLLAGPATLSIRYFGPDPLSGVPGWQSDWPHRSVLPQLVRIAIGFADGDGRAWPDLVIRPRAANGDNCQRDARSGACRGAG